jgi:hypothetical protein
MRYESTGGLSTEVYSSDGGLGDNLFESDGSVSDGILESETPTEFEIEASAEFNEQQFSSAFNIS